MSAPKAVAADSEASPRAEARSRAVSRLVLPQAGDEARLRAEPSAVLAERAEGEPILGAGELTSVRSTSEASPRPKAAAICPLS